MIYIVSILFLFILLYIPKTDYYLPRWRVVCLLGVLCLSFLISEKSSLTIGILCAYIMGSSLFHWFDIDKTHPCTSQYVGLEFKMEDGKKMVTTVLSNWVYFREIANCYLFFSLCCAIFLTIPDGILFNMDILAMLLLPIGIVTTVFYRHVPFIDKNHGAFVYGFGGNPSVNATLMANLSMFLFIDFERFMWLKIAILVCTFISILRTKAAAGVAALLAGVLTYVSIEVSYWIFLSASILALPAFLFLKKSQFLSMSGREIIWNLTIKSLIKTRPLFGLGLGSFYYILPAVQIKNRIVPKGKGFTWAHNDFLQFIAEGGLIGGVILFFAIFDILSNSITNTAALSFFMCYFVNALINFPSHMAPDCLIATIWMRIIYQ